MVGHVIDAPPCARSAAHAHSVRGATAVPVSPPLLAWLNGRLRLEACFRGHVPKAPARGGPGARHVRARNAY